MKKPLHAFAAAAALALGLALVPATALAQPTETDGIIVTVSQPGAGEVALLSDARAALDEAGIATGDVVSSDDGTLVLEARPADGQTDEQALATALDLPGVTDAQLNYVYQIIEPVADDPAATGLATTPDAITTQTLRQTILANDPYAQVSSPSAARNQYWLYSANIVDAWELARSQNVVTVAVLDSGITLDHPDLEDNILADLAWDSYYERTLVETGYVSDTTDNGGHGTAVAGVVAGVANNGTGVAGASYNANILPIKVVNDTTAKTNTVALANAFEYLLGLVKSGKAPNVRVINMSLGGYGDAFAEDDLLHSYISDARDDYGIVIVCAGGNGSNGQPQTEPIYPADYEECISVTSLEKDGTNLTYSDYNAYKDISAPGQGILSTSKNGDYASNSGTSLSAPIVSGAVSLMLYAEPNATPDEVYEALCQTATPVVDPDHDRTVPDENGVVSGSHGALDAGAAVSYLKEHVTRYDAEACVTCHHYELARKDWGHKRHAREMGLDCRDCHHKDTGIEPEPQNCADCHEAGAAPTHRPAEPGTPPNLADAVHARCITCHEDLFAKKVNGCASCHDVKPMREQPAEARSKVSPLYADCVVCHEAGGDKLLLGRMDAFHKQCMGCHESAGKGPFKKGQCAQCHTAK